MMHELAIFLWHKRISAHLQLILEALKLIVDFWTALYMVVPAVILLVITYRNLLIGLPTWFTPAGEMLLVVGLAYIMASGNPRSYLNETDMTFLNPNSLEFHRLFRVGILSSLTINNLCLLLVIVGLFPFYLHLEAVSIFVWLGIGLWLIILRTAFLLILFLLRGKVSRFAFRVLFFIGFVAAWTGALLPFIQTGNPLNLAWLLGMDLLMLVIIVPAKYLLPINNWEKIVQNEANYDIRLMGHLLGYAGKPMLKRNGHSLWSQQRFGISFAKKSTLTYFYVKYFLRLKLIRQILIEISGVCLLVSLSSLAYPAILGFLAAADLMLCLLVRSIVFENKEKLAIYTQALNINDSKKGLRSLYLIMMLPLCVFPVFSGLAGRMGLIGVLSGVIVMIAWVLISSYTIVNFSSL